MMIGLGHHQMSYSPAAAAAANALEADQRQRNSTDGRRGARSHLKNSSLKPEVGRQLSMNSDHFSDQNQHQHQAMQKQSSGSSARKRPEVVRVVAQTVHPILVDSLPNIRSPPPPQQQHRAARNQRTSSNDRPKSHSLLVSQPNELQLVQHEMNSSAPNERSHFLLQQQFEQQQQRAHQLHHSLAQHCHLNQTSGDDDQVLLIMSDCNSKTAGVPIIGRRLPSKSLGEQAPFRQPLLVRELPLAVTQAILHQQQQQQHQKRLQAAPVVGRRSHRLAQERTAGGGVVVAQAPYSAAAAAAELAASEQRRHRQRRVAATNCRPTASCNNAANSTTKRAVSRRLATNSSSCTSLCSPNSSSNSSQCLSACCQPPPVPLNRPPLESLASELRVTTTSACLLPCCFNGASGPMQQMQHARRTHQVRSVSQSTRRTRHCSPDGPGDCRVSQEYEKLNLNYDIALHQDERRSRRVHQQQSSHLISHNHLQQAPPVPCKPMMHSGRKSSRASQQMQMQMQMQMQLEENEHVTQMYESLAAELKAKLGNPNRAPILLPPRDYDTLSRQQGKLTGIELRRSTNPQLVGPTPAVAAATTTINELTQPQPSRETTPNSTDQLGELSSSRSSGRGSQPDESPVVVGAEISMPNTRGSSLQRSRSNSSSGLGSISLGARSPDSRASPSSKSSSSEDFELRSANKQQEAREEEAEISNHESSNGNQNGDRRRGKGIENHNPSKVAGGCLWNGRVEVPLKVNSERRNGNTYLATKQIIY